MSVTTYATLIATETYKIMKIKRTEPPAGSPYTLRDDSVQPRRLNTNISDLIHRHVVGYCIDARKQRYD